MDIKSKSSKKFSFLIALMLIAIATIGFGMMYPSFAKRASNYYVDELHSDDFLYQICKGSCVLYKDIAEAVQGKSIEYDELYLKTETQTSQEAAHVSEDVIDFVDWDEGNWDIMTKERMNAILLGWRNEIFNGLAGAMDYCVIDNRTGKSVKNVGQNLEMLGSGQEDSKLNELYPYYIRISFDSVGNPERVAVKSQKADELLKSVQRIMKSKYLWSCFWSNVSSDGIQADGSFYYYGEDGMVRKGKTTVFSTPRDVTCVFALTSQQKEALLNSQAGTLMNTRFHDEFRVYYYAGVPSTVHLIMLLLLLSAWLLPRCGKYCLHTLRITRLDLEVSGLAAFLLFVWSGEQMAVLVSLTNSGYFEEAVRSIFGDALGWGARSLIIIILNGCAIFLTFAVWYYLVTCWGDITVIGIRQFVRERSLLYRCFGTICGWTKRKINDFKEEILHADLGEKANKTIFKLVAVNFLLLAAACVMWVFGWAALVIYSIVLYFALKKYVQRIQEQYRKLLAATSSIAEGNLRTEFSEDWGVFESYKQELSKIQDGFKNAVEEEVKSQRMKTELITNVSHDLKTPLTAITTYIELLEDESISKEQRREYLAVLKKKSSRLKFLIEDLFEVSKATTGNVTLNLVDVDICHLMRQVYLEYEDRVEDAELIFRFRLPEEKVILRLDSQKTYRVFENLYVNIIKYAMRGTRVYVSADKTEKGIAIELKNMSASELNIAPEDLTERFVRGDSSRNTEGSGLGLAIAKSFVELQGGTMQVEIDGDLFKVMLVW